MINGKNVVAVIPAKGNSKRLAGKNLLDVWGKPMVAWSINALLHSSFVDKIIVNTNDERIINLAREHCDDEKVSFIKRDNTADEAPKQQIIIDSIRTLAWLDPLDVIVSLQPNSPQIISSHIDDIIDRLISTASHEIFSVNSTLLQNGAIRAMLHWYALQRELSTHCGVLVINSVDIHTIDDLLYVRSLVCPHEKYSRDR